MYLKFFIFLFALPFCACASMLQKTSEQPGEMGMDEISPFEESVAVVKIGKIIWVDFVEKMCAIELDKSTYKNEMLSNLDGSVILKVDRCNKRIAIVSILKGNPFIEMPIIQANEKILKVKIEDRIENIDKTSEESLNIDKKNVDKKN